jgi:hypothetical protein
MTASLVDTASSLQSLEQTTVTQSESPEKIYDTNPNTTTSTNTTSPHPQAYGRGGWPVMSHPMRRHHRRYSHHGPRSLYRPAHAILGQDWQLPIHRTERHAERDSQLFRAKNEINSRRR